MKAKKKQKSMKNHELKSETYMKIKYMKIKLNSDNKLALNKTGDMPIVTIVVRAIFHENNKCYPQIF